MLRHKGYSLIMWTLTFAALVVMVALIQVTLKRSLHSKIQQTSDYVLWTGWGQQAQLEPTERTSRSNAYSTQSQTANLLESQQGSITANSQNQSRENRVTSSVEKGSEVLLNEIDLN